MGSFSIWHWMIVLVIVMLVFGTKKLRNIGEDLGGAVKGFKEGMKDDVVTTANAQGMQKTCVQEVGSNTVSGAATGTGKYGPNQAPQVVVLRGDLVNICK